MIITSITYRRLKNIGNYENVTVEATSDVFVNENPTTVLRDLRAWVDSQMDPQKKADPIAETDGSTW